MPCNSTQMGPCQITNMRLWPATDYEPYRGRMSIDKVRWRLQLLHKDDVSGVYSDYSIRKMK